MNTLKGKMKDLNIDPLKPQEIQERLKKQLDSKGKDRGRTKFNHITNQQLRSIKYKARSSVNVNGSGNGTSLSKKESKAVYDDE